MMCMMLGLIVCFELEYLEDRDVFIKVDFMEQIQSFNMEELLWKLDIILVNLMWFVGVEWYGYIWGESLVFKYVI